MDEVVTTVADGVAEVAVGVPLVPVGEDDDEGWVVVVGAVDADAAGEPGKHEAVTTKQRQNTENKKEVAVSL